MQRFGRLGWVRIDVGIFSELGLLNLIGFLIFMVSSCLGGSGCISIDSLGFVLTWDDLKGLRWIYLEDRYKTWFVLDLNDFAGCV